MPADCNEGLHAAMLFGEQQVKQPNLLWPVEARDSVSALVANVLGSVPWGAQFLVAADGGVDWPRTVISGHSQGAGHAAYLSYELEVDAVLFSGPQDCNECAARWLKAMADEVIATRPRNHPTTRPRVT